MADQTPNPLSKFFRQPQLHLKLPSNGRWFAAGSIEMPATGELPVFAMTAKDELTIKTPDTLMNGQATVDVVQSCCPAIKDAWKVPTVDLDAILIAIRIATYGNRMEFTSVCPHCKNKNESALDLVNLLGTVTCPDFDSTIKIDDLEIFLKPQTFHDVNLSSMRTFEEQRLLAVVQNTDLSEQEKLLKFNELFRNVLNMTVKQISKNVSAIKLPDNTVVENAEFIEEFFTNCDRPIWNAVKDRLVKLANESELKRIPITCDNEECNETYETPLTFELSNFFG